MQPDSTRSASRSPRRRTATEANSAASRCRLGLGADRSLGGAGPEAGSVRRVAPSAGYRGSAVSRSASHRDASAGAEDSPRLKLLAPLCRLKEHAYFRHALGRPPAALSRFVSLLLRVRQAIQEYPPRILQGVTTRSRDPRQWNAAVCWISVHFIHYCYNRIEFSTADRPLGGENLG